MFVKNNIPVANIFYMLTYVFRSLEHKDFKGIEPEKYKNIADLTAGILIAFIKNQLKIGLAREYVNFKEPVSMLRGKICFSDSINHLLRKDQKLVCEYDVFSVNSYMNRILKTASMMLLKQNIDKERKQRLKSLMLYFHEVDVLDRNSINWKIQYNKFNKSYQLAITICHWLFKNLMLSENKGKNNMHAYDISDQDFEKLFEHFVLEYYKQKFKNKPTRVNADQIYWFDQKPASLEDFSLLPNMKTDITIQNKDKVFVIDTKTNNTILNTNQYENSKIRSGHLYQIFAYVKNKASMKCNLEKKVSGMLLYAKTANEELPKDLKWNIYGNEIGVAALNLNCSFDQIKSQLNYLVKDFL